MELAYVEKAVQLEMYGLDLYHANWVRFAQLRSLGMSVFACLASLCPMLMKICFVLENLLGIITTVENNPGNCFKDYFFLTKNF